jgi:hypothetical protein
MYLRSERRNNENSIIKWRMAKGRNSMRRWMRGNKKNAEKLAKYNFSFPKKVCKKFDAIDNIWNTALGVRKF